MSILKNSRGNTIVTLMGLSAVISIVIFSLHMQSNNFLKSVENTKGQLRYKSFLDSVKFKVQNPQICSTSILGGQAFSPTGPTSIRLSKVGFLSTGTANAPVDLNVGTQVDNMTIQKIELKNPTLIRDIQYDRAVGRFNKYSVDLVIEAEVKYGSTVVYYTNDPDIIALKTNGHNYSPIKIFIHVDPTNTIRACFGQSTVSAVCEDTGGAWDPFESDPIKRCHPDLKCLTKEIQSTTNCGDPLYTPIKLGHNGTNDVYICTRCNRYRP